MGLSPGTRFGPYQIVAPLGAGGMGEVYRARDTRLQREVAVKTLPVAFSSDPDRLHRFIREARVLASLNHPNIDAIYGLEELPSGERFLILELIEGETLAERLKRGALGIPEALKVCGAIAEALEAAHERGVIHRDLKPGNVMLTSRGTVKVLDFGLARHSGLSAESEATISATTMLRTETGLVLGTPGYMSPEQVRGAGQDRRTDIFAFGCVLLECLTGRRAFQGLTAADAMVAVLTVEPSWSALPPDTPRQIRELLARCLEKDPQQRLRDIGDARIEIEEARGTRQAAAAAGAPPHNLPKELTSFVGRERELSECRALFGETRLFTLAGVGGCGKTRLALKLAESLLEEHPDGTWFVELAPLSDPERVPLAVAAALGVREEPGKPILDSLARHLTDKRTLVVLDNCEHVLAACATLSERLLTSAAHLKLLVTSREGLGVKGERPYSVLSLSVPGPDLERDPRAVEASDAARLFVDRARFVAPDFRLTEKTAPAVAEICRRLDGIPLAIELAAARVRVLSVDQVRAKLDDRFRLLTGGSKTALPRHQTLRATIQWSYDHLAPEEQRLVRLLAVFAGGWALDAATAVAGDGADEFEVLDLLTHLVDKSLVVVEREAGGEARYRMLETVRQYAQERLNEAGEAGEARTRHLDFFLASAVEADSEIMGPEQTKWVARLERDHENVLSAHTWCDRAEGGAEKGLQLVAATRAFWHSRGLNELGLRVMREALGRKGAESPTRVRAVVLSGAGWFASRLSVYAEAHSLLEESLSISRALGDMAVTATSLRRLGIVAHEQGYSAEARGFYEESITISRQIGDKHLLCWGLNNLATIFMDEGAFEAAGSLVEEALALEREVGNPWGVAILLMNLADVAIQRGDLGAARGRLVESAALAEETGASWVGQGVLNTVAQLAATLGEGAFAARLFGVSEVLRERMGERRSPPDEQRIAPLMARARSELGESAFAAAYAAGGSLSYQDAIAEARAWLEQS